MMKERSGVVIQLPTACAEVVQQHWRAGRYPKAIAHLRDAKSKRDLAASQGERERQEQVESLKNSWHSAVAYKDLLENKMRALGAKPPIGETSLL